jgi:hypothetical protein
MALQQILCPQVQKLLHQPGLKIGFKQVGDLKLWGDVSTSTFRPLVPLPHRRQVFDHLHSPVHPDGRATRRLISSRYVWRGLQWWASLHDVITALQIGRYQFCLKR